MYLIISGGITTITIFKIRETNFSVKSYLPLYPPNEKFNAFIHI